MARERLLNGKEIKIVYDDPWFWKVSAYREVKKNDYHADREQRPRASIQFDDDRRPSAHDRPSARDRPRPSTCDRPRQNAPSRSHEDNRRRQDDSRDRRDKPSSKESLDRELKPTIPESMRVVVQEDVGAGGVVYDMNVVNSTKRRKVVIKKDQKPPALKIEAEEGEIESDAQIIGEEVSDK
jgi:hypothetical protein